MVKVYSIETGFFKLDGGAMFGVVPKRMWESINPPDALNMCTWAMRCLLVVDGDRKILIDTGIGNKLSDKMKSHFLPHGEDSLLSSLKHHGFAPEDITDVLLTHLHFDHVGGAVSLDDKGNYYPTFANANYWTNKAHFDWAMDPNPRERASFLKENFVPIKDAGQLKFIDVEQGIGFSDNIDLRFAYGHTEAMMIPIINTGSEKIAFCADLLPSSGHVSMPFVMSYDIRPLVTLEEKAEFFDFIYEDNIYCFLEHDKDHQLLSLDKNEKGRYKLGKTLSLNDLSA